MKTKKAKKGRAIDPKYAPITISKEAIKLSKKTDAQIFKIINERISNAQKAIINEAWEIYFSDGTNETKTKSKKA